MKRVPVRRGNRNEIPEALRDAVTERSFGWCECGCGAVAEHVHHRKLLSQGGKHELVNLLHLSSACHTAAHRNPERAYTLGLIVHGWADPGNVPVIAAEQLP